MRTTDLDLCKLSLAERIQLAEDLCDSVAAATGGLTPTEAQAARRAIAAVRECGGSLPPRGRSREGESAEVAGDRASPSQGHIERTASSVERSARPNVEQSEPAMPSTPSLSTSRRMVVLTAQDSSRSVQRTEVPGSATMTSARRMVAITTPPSPPHDWPHRAGSGPPATTGVSDPRRCTASPPTILHGGSAESWTRIASPRRGLGGPDPEAVDGT